MRAILPALSAALLCGCTAAPHPQFGAGAAPVGAPAPAVEAQVLAAAIQARSDAAQPQAIRLPERMVLPAAYRLVLLDGHLTLVRETDPQALEPGSSSMRLLSGDAARGELAYQPALLPQELAAEVASNRESSARMDNALDAVMRRSRELSQQAQDLEAQSRRLAELLAASEARVRQLEAEAKAAAQPAPGAPARAAEP